jgi:hypothetical protein
MTHRFTIKELEEKSDEWVLYQIVNDKWAKLKNPYTPLAKRLAQILKKLHKEAWDKGDFNVD